MSSKSIYPHVPYFYIIEHIASGKKYAGCRYAKGCNPVEFMKLNGYCTSSKLVKKIIDEEGIDAFKIIEIRTGVGDVYDYETKFLVENDCAKSDQWLNQHNNTKMTSGTEEFRLILKEKYGVEHALESKECREKYKNTCSMSYGVENPSQLEMIKEKKRLTCLRNFGVENPGQSEELKSKRRCTKRKNTEIKINQEIANGNFDRFEYLWDTIDKVFLIGVRWSLNYQNKNRYIKIGVCRGHKMYIDALTGKFFRIDSKKFSSQLPINLVEVDPKLRYAKKGIGLMSIPNLKVPTVP